MQKVRKRRKKKLKIVIRPPGRPFGIHTKHKKKRGRKKAKNPVGRPRKKHIPKVNVRTEKIMPLTSIEQYTATRKAINAKNRDRSKAMERRIAQYLRGRRIPLSGAASKYKGDVEILFINNPGGYLIECKLSAQVSRGIPLARIRFDWFTKITREAENMNAKFGVLILHFHGNTNDFVFVSNKALYKIMKVYNTPFTESLEHLLLAAPLVDIRYSRAGKVLAGYSLERKLIESNMVSIEGLIGMRLLLPDDEYLVLPLNIFRMIVDQI